MGFIDECLKITTSKRIDIKDEVLNVPTEYEATVNSIIQIMKPYVNKFNVTHFKFVENALANKQRFISAVEKSTVNGDIPDAIICKLARGLYDKTINEVSDEQQAIIKVLACYICILK